MSASGSCQIRVFSRKGFVFCHEVFFRIYLALPLALEVYNRMLIDSLCRMAVDEFKKLLLGFTQ